MPSLARISTVGKIYVVNPGALQMKQFLPRFVFTIALDDELQLKTLNRSTGYKSHFATRATRNDNDQIFYMSVSLQRRSSFSFPQPLQGSIIQLHHNFSVIFDQGEDRLARTLPPLVTAVKGILAFFALSKTVVAAH